MSIPRVHTLIVILYENFDHLIAVFSRGWTYPTSMDNMIKQWHSIDAVWNLMNNTNHYDRVGLFRVDVKYKTPIDISDADAVIPNFQHWGGLRSVFYRTIVRTFYWPDTFSNSIQTIYYLI